MVGSDQIIIDEVEMGVHIIRNKIGEIFQDVFVREVNRLIYVAVNEHRDGCKMEDLSQLHHTCLTTDAQEAWATYFEYVKGKVDLKTLWKLAQQEVENRLNLQLKETWLKYLVCLCKMDTSTVYLLYMDFLRRDECHQLGCYEYMFEKDCSQ